MKYRQYAVKWDDPKGCEPTWLESQTSWREGDWGMFSIDSVDTEPCRLCGEIHHGVYTLVREWEEAPVEGRAAE